MALGVSSSQQLVFGLVDLSFVENENKMVKIALVCVDSFEICGFCTTLYKA